MDTYREQMRKYYYDPSKYKTYLEQLGIKYPTTRTVIQLWQNLKLNRPKRVSKNFSTRSRMKKDAKTVLRSRKSWKRSREINRRCGDRASSGLELTITSTRADAKATGRSPAFSPRKKDLTLYIMMGFEKHPELMKQLGKHSTGKSCLYIKRLSDIHMPTLKKLIKSSVKQLKDYRFPD